MKKKLLLVIVSLMLAFSAAAAMTGCGDNGGSNDNNSSDTAKTPENPTLRLATTTSTKDSGLLDEILPDFEEKTGYKVDVISVGSGEAMELGEKGEADVLLVHSPEAEKEFVDGGHADSEGRMDVMYNDFVILGPKSDPAGIEKSAKEDAIKAFTAIKDQKQTFVSRADDSGTHKKELEIWKDADIEPKGDWYVQAAAGMGDVITMTDEKQGYTLSDRATWLNVGKDTDLKIVSEKDASGILNNQYGVICVNPDKNEAINAEGAKAFREWIVSSETQDRIGEYGKDEYGESLFIPNAK